MENLIVNGEVNTNETPHEMPEQTVQFRKYTDFQTISIRNEKDEVVASISGYGFECGFDFKYLKTQEDVESLSKSIADVVMQIMMDAAINAAGEVNK